MNWQDIAVAVIGVAVIAVLVRRIFRFRRRKADRNPYCCGCPLAEGCNKRTRPDHAPSTHGHRRRAGTHTTDRRA